MRSISVPVVCCGVGGNGVLIRRFSSVLPPPSRLACARACGLVGFFADYLHGEMRPDGTEIEDAKWCKVGAFPLTPAPGSIAVVASAPAPPGGKEVAADVSAAVRKRMVALTDGKGVMIAYDPGAEDSFAPFYAGRNDALYAQRISGGSREGDQAFDRVFWEPRVNERWQASFGKKDGKHWLQCGERKIELSPAKLARDARLLQVRWQRRLVQLARTDDLVYFVVDQAREPEGNRDYRLHIGRPGAFTYVKVDEALLERDESLYVTAQGRLQVGYGASWTPKGGAPVPLKPLPVEDHAGEAYGPWRLYAEPLGTPCDGVLP